MKLKFLKPKVYSTSLVFGPSLKTTVTYSLKLL